MTESIKKLKMAVWLNAMLHAAYLVDVFIAYGYDGQDEGRDGTNEEQAAAG